MFLEQLFRSFLSKFDDLFKWVPFNFIVWFISVCFFIRILIFIDYLFTRIVIFIEKRRSNRYRKGDIDHYQGKGSTKITP